jgi:phosphatidylinositol glycan class M
MRHELLLSLAALAVRVIIIFYGEIQDRTPGLHYTDIDYLVFSDAADHVVEGSSPYKRPTYRYPPLLAYLLVPNSLFGRKYGKLLFAFFDVATGCLIRLLVKSPFSYFLWDLNPFVINISTRGNSDSITSFLLVLVLFLLERNWVIAAAIAFGVSVHLRIFPVFLCLSILFFLKSRIVWFGVVSWTVFVILTLFFFWLYQAEFVRETYLYHLVRRDYRHNFAPPWLSVYLGADPTASWGTARLVLIAALSVYFKADLRGAWAAIIVCFIGYNPVCTVQYFDWAIAMLALIPERICTRRFLACFAIWLVPHGVWLGTAYLLEFRAMDVFHGLWCASVAVFIGHNVLLYGIIAATERRPVKAD